METKVNYTLVGIFVLLLLTAIVIAAVWLSAGLGSQNYKTYLVYMNESVAGLVLDAPVKYNGVTVGQVSNIELNLKNPQQVILTLQIQPHIPITETTYAILMEQGITGIAFIGLQTGEPAPLLKPTKGQKYPVIPSQPSFLMMLDQTIQRLSDNFNDMSTSIKAVISKQNVQNFQDTLTNLQKITANISANSQNISASLTDLKTVMKNTATTSKEFPSIIDSINKGSQSIQALTKSLSATSQTINTTAAESNIAIQSFANDILPQAYEALKNIRRATNNFSDLSGELTTNPSIIIKGKTPDRLGPGE